MVKTYTRSRKLVLWCSIQFISVTFSLKFHGLEHMVSEGSRCPMLHAKHRHQAQGLPLTFHPPLDHYTVLTGLPPTQPAMAEPGTTMIPPAFSLRKDDLVTLLIGPEEEEFIVHESCITRNSDFFKAAMRKEWIEGQARIIRLPEETRIESFVIYLNFAYHEQLPSRGIMAFVDDVPLREGYIRLAEIYVIGERMLDKLVRNAVTQELLRLTTLESPNGSRTFLGSSNIAMLYNGTSTGSPMRRMIVDFYATYGSADWPYKSQHHEFLEDLAKRLQEQILAQEEVRDFRTRELVAEDYFV